MRLLVVGNGPSPALPLTAGKVHEQSTQLPENDRLRSYLGKFWLLMFCSAGLVTNFLLWGWLQEKIMTTAYWVPVNDGSEKKLQTFKETQFLVFVNRIVALIVSLTYILLCNNKDEHHHQMPFYKYFFASFSNIISSWCQYEALKFITFPTQTLGKASKIIPVMIMGKFVERKTYSWHEYLTSGMISLGVCMFLLSGETASSSGKRFVSETTWSGIVLMIGYMVFDSFTTNWQDALYCEHHVTRMQMMCGINFFSMILTMGALVEQRELIKCILTVWNSSEILRDVLLVSITSTVGQMFIFYTIYHFGAVTFTIIMTIRQALAILLSLLYYGHKIYVEGILGIFVIFFSLFLRSYLAKRHFVK